MANIDDYIAQLSKEINRKGSGYSFIESNRMSEAIKYKETLKSLDNGFSECDADNGYHCPEGNYQTCAVVTIVGDLRDRDADTTISQAGSFIDYLNSSNDIYYASVTIVDDIDGVFDFKFNQEDISQSTWNRRNI